MQIINTLKFIAHHPLNRNRKAEALLRWLRWQIGSRLVPGPVAVNYVNDAKLLVLPGMTGATGNIYTGLHEFEDMSFVLHALRPNDLFIDVGANIGSYTILASAVVGAKSISIEPIADTFEKLRMNISLNSIQGLVDAYNIGISNEETALKFISDADTENHVASAGECLSKNLLKVEVRTLDKLLAGKQPNIMKIDVEGFETNVIAGADRILSEASLNAVIMELNGSGNRYGFDEESLHKKMLGYGYKTFSYSPFERKFTALDDKRSNTGSTLYIKNIAFATDRVSGAPRFQVHGQSL